MFFNQEYGYSLDDVYLEPGYSDIVSRRDVSLSSIDRLPSVKGNHPLIASNMNALAGKRVAETMWRYGGLTILPQDRSISKIESILTHIDEAHSVYDTGIWADIESEGWQLSSLMEKKHHGILLIRSQGEYVGYVTREDISKISPHQGVRSILRSKDMIDISDLGYHPTLSDVYTLLGDEYALPIKTSDGIYVVSKDMLALSAITAPSLHRGITVAVGINQSMDRVDALIGMGVNSIVLDTAHGHQAKMIDRIKSIRQDHPNLTIIAGNVCTAQGAEDLVTAGANILKVNVGPGAMCTTRLQTGFGSPTFTAVMECSQAVQDEAFVWADGGVRYPRDVSIYLAAGASRVVVGTAFVGCYESPPSIETDAQGSYKRNFGMASHKAVSDRVLDTALEKAIKSLYQEGISSSKIYLSEGGSLIHILGRYITGLQSALSYAGAKDIRLFQRRVEVRLQTSGGYHEGTPHGKVRL